MFKSCTLKSLSGVQWAVITFCLFQKPVHPTSGILAVFVALNYCDVVHIAGFGYPNSKSQRQPIHYYGYDTMKSMKVGSSHLQYFKCSLCFNMHAVLWIPMLLALSVAEFLPWPQSWSRSLKKTGGFRSRYVPAPTFMIYTLWFHPKKWKTPNRIWIWFGSPNPNQILMCLLQWNTRHFTAVLSHHLVTRVSQIKLWRMFISLAPYVLQSSKTWKVT